MSRQTLSLVCFWPLCALGSVTDQDAPPSFRGVGLIAPCKADSSLLTLSQGQWESSSLPSTLPTALNVPAHSRGLSPVAVNHEPSLGSSVRADFVEKEILGTQFQTSLLLQ